MNAFSWRAAPTLLLISVFATSLAQGRPVSTAATQSSDARHPNTKASFAPVNVHVPALAFDDTSIVLVWSKPEHYENIVGYQVYMGDKLLGTALENARQYSQAQAYVDKFYADDKQNIHVKVTNHNFTIAGLKPATSYRFSVRSVFGDGSLSAPSKVLSQKTAATPTVCDVTVHGAVGDGTAINTKAIQDAINTCPANGKVLIPAGVFKSGALFLKSNMTLEVAQGATLLGSDRAEDYPLARGYTLYEYSSVNRPPSLINALDPMRRAAGTFANIRIVGGGTIDGNGWKRQATPSIIDEAGRTLPQYIAGNNQHFGDGILAKAQMDQAIKDGLSAREAYGQRRSSLMTLRGVKNLYIAGVSVLNPAFHGVMALETENVTVNGVAFKTFDVNNGDGIEFGNSQHITFFNNFLDTGDDDVNFAAGTGADAAKQPVQSDAWIFNNYFRKGHGAVVAGSHTGAWIEKILAEDNVAVGTEIGLRGKSNNINGGGGRNIVYRDNAMKNLLRQAYIFTLEYSDTNGLIDYQPATEVAQFHDILVKHNSVEFTGNGQTGEMKSNGSPALSAYPVIHIQGDMKSNAYHERIVFDDVVLVNSNPAQIDGLKGGVFRDVQFKNVKGGNPWSIKNAPDIVFEGSTTPPAK